MQCHRVLQCAMSPFASTRWRSPFPQARWEELLPKHQAMEADHELLKKVRPGAQGSTRVGQWAASVLARAARLGNGHAVRVYELLYLTIC